MGVEVCAVAGEEIISDEAAIAAYRHGLSADFRDTAKDLCGISRAESGKSIFKRLSQSWLPFFARSSPASELFG